MKNIFSTMLFALLGCFTVNANNYSSIQNIKNTTDTTYTYYDAARNKYVLRGDTLEYTPVKPAESSSGIYDGGNYVKIKISGSDKNNIVFLFIKGKASKKAQTKKNIKPNAFVEIEGANRNENFILKAASSINIELKNLLQQLLIN